MNTNKTVQVKYQTYKMYQVTSTGWVFVRGPKTGRGYPLGEIVDGVIVARDNEPAIRGVSNEDLLAAWLEQ